MNLLWNFLLLKYNITCSNGMSSFPMGISAPVLVETNTLLTLSHLDTASSTVFFSWISLPPLTPWSVVITVSAPAGITQTHQLNHAIRDITLKHPMVVSMEKIIKHYFTMIVFQTGEYYRFIHKRTWISMWDYCDKSALNTLIPHSAIYFFLFHFSIYT